MSENSSGWNRPASNQPATKKGGAKAPSMWKGVVAGVVTVCALGGLCLWMFSGGEVARKAKPDKERGRIKEVKASIPVRADNRVESPAPVVAEPEEKKRAETKPTQPAVLFPPGRKKVHAVITNFMGSGNSVHRNATEQMLLRLFSTEVGDAPRPMGRIPADEKKRLVEILIDKNEITEKDTEATAMSKELLAQAKKHMMEYIKEGGEPEDFFEHYHMQLVDAFKKRMQADEILHEAIDGGDDPEYAKEFCKKINEELEKEGIKPLKLTRKERGEL